MRTLLAFLLSAAALAGATFRAGVGRSDITPAAPIWLSGYAARSPVRAPKLGEHTAEVLNALPDVS